MECKHKYFPHRGSDGKVDGQKCNICGQFNPLESLVLTQDQIDLIRDDWGNNLQQQYRLYKNE